MRKTVNYRIINIIILLFITFTTTVTKQLSDRQGHFVLRCVEIGKEMLSREEMSPTVERRRRAQEEEGTTGHRTAGMNQEEHRKVGFSLTQLLYFQTHPHRIGRTTFSDCLYCPGVIDDTEHIFFTDEKWAPTRRFLVSVISAVSSNSNVGVMFMKRKPGTEYHKEHILRRRNLPRSQTHQEVSPSCIRK